MTGIGYQKKTPVPEVWLFGAECTHALILGNELYVSSAPNLISWRLVVEAAPCHLTFQHLYGVLLCRSGGRSNLVASQPPMNRPPTFRCYVSTSS